MIDTIYERGGGVYNGCGIYNGRGIYDHPKDMVWLNGKYVKDTYYERQDGNVGSTFKDLVSLPEGYTKLDYVFCNRFSSASSLIITDFQLPNAFSIRTCFNTMSVTVQFPYIYSTIYSDENGGVTRLINGASTNDFYVTISAQARTSDKLTEYIKSFEMNQDGENRSYRKSLLSDDRTTFSKPYVDEYNNRLTLLSYRGQTKMFTLIVLDKSNRVLFTAIPCVHDGAYGLYDLVSNQFYDSQYLTGA